MLAGQRQCPLQPCRQVGAANSAWLARRGGRSSQRREPRHSRPPGSHGDQSGGAAPGEDGLALQERLLARIAALKEASAAQKAAVESIKDRPGPARQAAPESRPQSPTPGGAAAAAAPADQQPQAKGAASAQLVQEQAPPELFGKVPAVGGFTAMGPPDARTPMPESVARMLAVIQGATEAAVASRPLPLPLEDASEEEMVAYLLSKSSHRRQMPFAAEPADIVFVSAEVAPWSKTGGLGDVLFSLPVAMAARGHRVTVVTGRYCNEDNAHVYAGLKEVATHDFDLHYGNRVQVTYYHQFLHGVDFLFVDHPAYRRAGTPYADQTGRPWDDNLFRWHLLSLSALEAPLILPLSELRNGDLPEGTTPTAFTQRITFISNDWHTALLPVLLRDRYQPWNVYKDATSILTIHNMAHQGVYNVNAFNELGLDGSCFGHFEWIVPDDRARTLNIFKAGVMAADAVVTVSQSYAQELIEEPQLYRADLFLAPRKSDLWGIVNGADTVEWNPSTDVHLRPAYGPHDVAEGKAANKRLLLREMRMPSDEGDMPLVAFIGRLDYQKGPDIMLEMLGYLANMDVQVVLLGSGASDYEAAFQQAEQDYAWFTRVHVGFDVCLAHRILAAADILLMPSRFEPCGLTQLYAMRYGTIPIANATGGLADTIDDYNPFSNNPDGEGTGWTFSPACVDACVDAVSSALRVYHNEPHKWAAMRVRGMKKDIGWRRAAGQYEQVIADVLARTAEEQEQEQEQEVAV